MAEAQFTWKSGRYPDGMQLARFSAALDLTRGPRMTNKIMDPPAATGAKILSFQEDLVNFGELPEATNALLQSGVLTYRNSREKAEQFFQEALALDSRQLPVYYCLYKIYTYQGRLDEALSVAQAGLREAARQAGWSEDYREWERPSGNLEGAARFALYTLKAQAFIHLRRDEPGLAQGLLDQLAKLDPAGEVGWHVIAALAQGSA